MIRGFFQRLMYGRYGADQLNITLLVLFWVLWLASYFISIGLVSNILLLLSYAAIAYSIFRMFSRNCSARQRENEWFLRHFGGIGAWFRTRMCRARDRDHRYFKCPTCGCTLRVPRGKGKISISCRQCGTVFQEKT